MPGNNWLPWGVGGAGAGLMGAGAYGAFGGGMTTAMVDGVLTEVAAPWAMPAMLAGGALMGAGSQMGASGKQESAARDAQARQEEFQQRQLALQEKIMAFAAPYREAQREMLPSVYNAAMSPTTSAAYVNSLRQAGQSAAGMGLSGSGSTGAMMGGLAAQEAEFQRQNQMKTFGLLGDTGAGYTGAGLGMNPQLGAGQQSITEAGLMAGGARAGMWSGLGNIAASLPGQYMMMNYMNKMGEKGLAPGGGQPTQFFSGQTYDTNPNNSGGMGIEWLNPKTKYGRRLQQTIMNAGLGG